MPHRQITGRLVIATHNPGKLVEMRELLSMYGVEAVAADELKLAEPEETGKTFAANARIKAEAAAKTSGMPAFADNSGLAVDALDGDPGIRSARWAGPDKDFRRAMNQVQTRLIECGAKAVERRRAHFVSALCVAWPDGHVEEFEARVNGTVVWPPRGTQGSATIRCSCRTARPARSAKCRLKRSTACHRAGKACRIAPALSSSSRRRALPSADPAAFGVYVHWPFCLSKCPYCDFNSHVRHAAIDEARFLRAFETEIATTAARIGGRTVTSIFLGGGTPSLMQPATVGAHPRGDRSALERRARRRGDAGGQPDQRRGDALPRLSRGRRQPGLARRAGA